MLNKNGSFHNEDVVSFTVTMDQAKMDTALLASIRRNQETSWRWYLCFQVTPMKWECMRTFGEIALDAYLYGREKRPTKAVPVPQYYPEVFDSWVLKNALNPEIRIAQDRTSVA